jgi:MutS domain V
MKALLLHADRVFEASENLPTQAETVEQDLEAGTLLDAMTRKDPFLRDIAERVLMDGLAASEAIRYRQQILTDCLGQPEVIRELYELAFLGTEVRRDQQFFWFRDSPDSLVKKSVGMLSRLFEILRELRRLADQNSAAFTSPGLTRMCTMLQTELDDDYLHVVSEQLDALHFRDGTLTSAALGRANRGTDFVLRKPKPEGILQRLAANRQRHTFAVAPRDESGIHALGDLRDRGVRYIGDALAQSTDHVMGFCNQLRTELAFYVACLNLHEELAARGLATCLPDPVDEKTAVLGVARGLYDPALALHLDSPPVASDLDSGSARLVIVTGANQGGKSTFLRSIGLAQLMMQAGMFVCATGYRATVCTGLYTHFKREEDSTMTRGKLEEELQRMSDIAEQIRPGALLLCNESFASTNEREGSEIALQVTQALIEAGVRVVFVTHLYDFASTVDDHSKPALFLRAERLNDGERTFRVVPGEPLPTSHGLDSYQRIFATTGRTDLVAVNPMTNDDERDA